MSVPGALDPALVHPELAPALERFQGFTVSADTLPALRGGAPVAPPTSTEAVEVVDHVVDATRGIVLRVHRPRAALEPVPCVLSIHGGGYVMGDRSMDDAKLTAWASTLGCAGAAVEYRLAPETPYPGALDDCTDALRWLLDHDRDLGVDADRVGVAGVSAGGGLAAALALRARDEGGMQLRFQLLESPMLDDRQQTRSSRLDGLPVWDRHANTFGWRSYLGARAGSDAVPALAAPARATDLSDLPPAFVAVGSVDGFHDEDVDYAVRLNRAGVPTELHVYPGAPHGFQIFEDSSVARQARRDAGDWLARHLDG